MSPATGSEISPETVVPALTQATGLLLRRLRADANPGGLSVSQTAVLARLDDSGSLTNADLARAEAMKPQSMNALLGGLEQAGLVARRRHPSDGRQILFSLTEQGVEARRRRTSAKQAWLVAAVARLTPEDQKTLMTAAALIRGLADS